MPPAQDHCYTHVFFPAAPFAGSGGAVELPEPWRESSPTSEAAACFRMVVRSGPRLVRGIRLSVVLPAWIHAVRASRGGTRAQCTKTESNSLQERFCMYYSRTNGARGVVYLRQRVVVMSLIGEPVTNKDMHHLPGQMQSYQS